MYLKKTTKRYSLSGQNFYPRFNFFFNTIKQKTKNFNFFKMRQKLQLFEDKNSDIRDYNCNPILQETFLIFFIGLLYKHKSYKRESYK